MDDATKALTAHLQLKCLYSEDELISWLPDETKTEQKEVHCVATRHYSALGVLSLSLSRSLIRFMFP